MVSFGAILICSKALAEEMFNISGSEDGSPAVKSSPLAQDRPHSSSIRPAAVQCPATGLGGNEEGFHGTFRRLRNQLLVKV